LVQQSGIILRVTKKKDLIIENVKERGESQKVEGFILNHFCDSKRGNESLAIVVCFDERQQELENVATLLQWRDNQ
jgi:hypothetical protein